MPKNPLKGFARRKSSGNVLDLQSEQPAHSSFRVLERPDKITPNGVDRRTVSARPLSAMPFHQRKGKSSEDLGGSTNNRGSGTTTLSAGSSGYYDTSSSSARYSSTSTLPSSVDQEHEQAQEELFPAKDDHIYSSQTHQPFAAPTGAPNPSFSSRASRAMSFGLKSRRPNSQATTPEPTEQIPTLPDHAAIRDRATTVSSYASTAVPPRLEASVGSSDFSSDFGNMFEGLGDSKKEMPLPPPPRAHGGYLRSDSEPMFQSRPFQRPAVPASHDPEPKPQPQPPAHRTQRPQQLAATRRYSWQSRTSNDGLMSPGTDADMASPQSSEFSQNTVKAPTGFGRFRPGYQPVPVRYSSPQGDSQPGTPDFFGQKPIRTTSISSDEDLSHPEDESRPASRTEPKVLASSMQHVSAPHKQSQQMPPIAKHPAVASIRDDLSSTGSADGSSSFGKESQSTTPKAMKLQPHTTSDDMFDVSPAGPARTAIHATTQPRLGTNPSSPHKRMTRAQFEMQQAARENYDSESENGSEDGYDDGDEEERQAELAKQRRKQEANLAVYRQQMKRVSGGEQADLPAHMQRPSMDRASLSAPSLHQGMSMVPEGVIEEDDDVPLGILQAHGFPNKNRPPAHFGGETSAPATPGSQMGAPMGDGMGGTLPPFARRLPQMPPDPYFGAGIVNQSNRESLAFGGANTGSVYGGAAPAVQPVHAGGLVGVIAGEERARAARRGSPNPATGGYGPLPLPNNMQMPSMMPRSNSMMSMMQPQMGGVHMQQMPSMHQMPPMPMMSPMAMDSQQQMFQMMQMQQQMMQSIMQMQAGQPPSFTLQQSQSMGNGFLDPNGNGSQRPMSMASQGPSNAGRTMSMMQAPPQWNGNSAHGRANTMSNQPRPMGYAGSVYNYNLSAPAPGYTPSIAPSERSNIGMPSRYRPVSTTEANGGDARTQTMNSNMDSYARQNSSTPSLLGVNSQVPKSTIRVIDKPKGTPKSSTPRSAVEDEDEDEGWAAMRKKREARKKRGPSQAVEAHPALSELYTAMQ